MTDQTGGITYARTYDPYGVVTYTSGTSQTAYGFTGEQYGDSTQLLYLRARYYNPADGRFQSRDTWSGDYNNPLSLNRWMYVEGNPVNLIDPSGMMACPKSNDPECITLINELKVEAQHIHTAVKEGTLLPVEGFAQLADSASNKFNQNIRGTLWAMTLIINGFDANSFVPISYQAYIGGSNYPSQFIGLDWLPYNDAACDDIKDYFEHGDWICSERGDWKVEYWDKTANQAYHGWFFTAATFFDGRGVATFANWWHEVAEGPFEPIPVDGPPPVSGITVEDYALSLKMMELGSTLYFRQRYFDQLLGTCPLPNSVLNSNLKNLSIGSWIRSNLKDYSVR